MTLEASRLLDDQRRERRQQAGAWLRACRENIGLTQRDLATDVGAVYYTFISQIEVGKGRLPPERYSAWANALNIPDSDFASTMLYFYEPITYSMIFGQTRPTILEAIQIERIGN